MKYFLKQDNIQLAEIWANAWWDEVKLDREEWGPLSTTRVEYGVLSIWIYINAVDEVDLQSLVQQSAYRLVHKVDHDRTVVDINHLIDTKWAKVDQRTFKRLKYAGKR